MIADPVTTRWAGALFNLAKKSDALDAVQADVDRLAVELASPAVCEFLFSAQVGRADRRAKLVGVVDSFHPLTKNFVHLLFDKRREEVLRTLPHAFKARMLEERGEVEGVVESARKLDAEEIAKLAESLGQRLGKKVVLENQLQPELMSGVRVTVGARMIDSSVQGRLEALRRRMLDAPLSAAKA